MFGGVAGAVEGRKGGNSAVVGTLDGSTVYRVYGGGGVGSWLSRELMWETAKIGKVPRPPGTEMTLK